MWEEVLLILVSFRSQIVDVILDLVILVYYNAISIDFYEVNSLSALILWFV